MKNISVILTFLAVQNYSIANAYVGSVTAATGGAGKAAVEASENPFGNPAGLAYLSGYYFTAGWGAAKQTNQMSSQDLSVSLTDNMRDTVVPTSLSYVQNSVRPERSEESLNRDIKLSFGNFIRPGFAFGMGIEHSDDRLLNNNYQQTNMQLGFLVAPNKDLGFAATFDNLLPTNKSIPQVYRQNQTMGAGISWNFKRLFRFKADLTSASNNTWGKPTIGGGMESYLNKWLILRMGASRNAEQEANIYTAGMGFVGPKFGFHYAYQNSPKEESLTRHSVDMAIPVW